jgi:hypothetical protein
MTEDEKVRFDLYMDGQEMMGMPLLTDRGIAFQEWLDHYYNDTGRN